MKKQKDILGINDKQVAFESIHNKIVLLNKGFTALNMDYSYHIETTFGKKHRITDLKKNIDYRLFSSQFHLELLFRQHHIITNRIEQILKTEPEKVIRTVLPSNPIFDNYEKEVSSILDSIIFHLASVYDYVSAIINFICNNKDESISKWSSLNNSCVNINNHFSKKKIAVTIKEQHNLFVNKLYSHRSRLIHKTSDVHPISLSLELVSEKANVNFFATSTLTRNFKELRDLSKTKRITLEYVAKWLIENTINSIFELIYSLKSEIESMSDFPNHVKDKEIVMVHRDPKTGIAQSPSIVFWEQIKAEINSK